MTIEADRLDALHRCDLLDTPPERRFDDIVWLAAHLCRMEISLISLIDRDRQWFKSRFGLEAKETPRDHAFCAHAIRHDGAMEVEDARRDDRFRDNPLVTGPPHIRHYVGVPIRSPDGFALGTLCVIDSSPGTLDTERREGLSVLARQVETQIRLDHAREQAVAASAVKNRFLATVGHEIRTPMTAIIGYAERNCRSELSSAERLVLAGRIRHNCDALQRLIDDLVDGSRIEAGELEIRLETHEVAALLEDVREMLEPDASRKSLALTVTCEGSCPRLIRTDYDRTRQILLNLVSNAIKYTERGAVEIRAGADETSRHAVSISVIDTGVGIPDGQLAALFEPFARGERSSLLGEPGFGLGLHVSRQLAHLLGGELDASSRPGAGSRFTLRLGTPIHGCASSTAARETGGPAGGDSASAASSSISGRRVLVVDDSEDIRRIVRYLLEDHDARVAEAANGRDALETIRGAERDGEPYDVVLLDMQMPGLDGYGVARHLRAAGVTARVIALTAFAMTGDREKCLDSGCDDYVSKPIVEDRLIRAITAGDG